MKKVLAPLLLILICNQCSFTHKSQEEVVAEKEEVNKTTTVDLLYKYSSKFKLKNHPKFLVVNFIEYYCAPCFAEVPFLNKIEKENQNKNIQFVSFYKDDFTKLNNNLNKIGGFNFDLFQTSSDKLRENLCEKYSSSKNETIRECYLPSTFVINIETDKIVYRQLQTFSDEDKIKFQNFINGIK